MFYNQNFRLHPANQALRWMNAGKGPNLPQLPPRATRDLTFKEVGLQPEFEAYDLAVTPPGVGS